MNYINQDKNYKTDEERIKYLEESIRELRNEKEQLKKEKGEIRQRLLKLEKAQAELSRAKENKELEEENKKLKSDLAFKNTMLDNVKAEYESLQNDIKKLEEERDFFKEQAILWRKDWKVAYEEKRKLESDLGTVIDERDNAFKKIKQLEERLDNKEKVNKNLREEIRNLKKELGKITVHSNMLESENILLKKECKARLDKIEELEKEIEELNKMMLFETELEK